MKLDNFKELLNKKAENNPNLQLLIKYMRDEYLVEHVVESLNKMARSYSNKNTNNAVMHFGTHMDSETEGDMIRNALSHHASHYKSALNSGNEKLADSHMKKIFQIMHLSEKLTRDGLNDHSSGKLKIEAVDPKPWERSGYSNISEKTGRFSTDTKGWSRSSNNYGWLRGAPHESYKKETDAHGHTQAYPLSQIKVNGKYIHIEDIDPQNDHVDHEFDSHPIMKYYKSSPSSHNSEKHNEYISMLDDYGDTIDSFIDRTDALEGYGDRGLKASDPIHKPLLSAEESKAKLEQMTGQASEPSQSVPKAAVQTQAAPGSQVEETKRKLAMLKKLKSGKKL